MSDPDESTRKREMAVANAIASSSLEGHAINARTRENLANFVTGKVAIDTLVEEVIQRHTRKHDLLMPLIAAGALPQGTRLSCALPEVEGLVAADGITVRGTTFSDPTAAMAHVLGETPPADAGWEFWKVDDPVRGFTKPLEHVRTAYASRHEADAVRNSDTHPLRINGLRLPGLPGEIGMTFCPGKKSDSIYGGRWNRDLEKDISVIRAWGAAAVVTLLEDHEFELLGIPEFPD